MTSILVVAEADVDLRRRNMDGSMPEMKQQTDE